MVSLEKLMILIPLQKLPKNGGDWCKLIVAKGFKSCPKSNKFPNLVTLNSPSTKELHSLTDYVAYESREVEKPILDKSLFTIFILKTFTKDKFVLNCQSQIF